MNNIIQGKKYRITILSEILLRLEYSETGEFLDETTEFARNRVFPTCKFNIQQDERFLVIETSYYRLEYIKEKPFYGTKFVPEANLKVLLKDTDRYWYFNHVEARNFKTIGICLDNVENIKLYNKGLYSTDGFVSIDDSNSLIIKNDMFYKRSVNEIDTYLFMYKRDFGKVLRDYFILTNKPSMIPRYMLGNIWNKSTNYTDLNIEELINKFNKNNIPLSLIILGNKWHNKNGLEYGLNWNKDLFIDYNKFINNLKTKNIYLGVTINPMEISKNESNFNEFKTLCNIDKDENIMLNVYDKNMMDNYFKVFINNLINSGINTFLIDYTNIKDLYSLRVLNYYHSKYFKDNNLRLNILSRNGLINSHNTNILYTGKTLVSWDFLKKLPEYIISGSNIGINFISNDIGGYYGGIEDDELYRRYIELGTFSPILRLSSDSSEYYKREPWKWDINTLTIAKYYLRLRCELIPYTYTESYNYVNTGIPFIRPIYYNYPEIYDEIEYRNEYYFGNNLLVCPITKPKDIVMNRTIQQLFIPEGIWYDFKTGIKYVGNKRYISFYKDEDYPVFATQGSIIPLAILDEDNLNNSNNPNGFVIHIFPGKSNTYTLYEDDGITLSKDKYVKTIIDYNYMLNNYTVIIRHDVTDSTLVPNIRNYIIKFRNTRKPNDITIYIGEDKLENYKTYIDDNDFVIELNNVNTFKQITINSKGQDIEIETSRLINKDIDDIISSLKIKTTLKSKVNEIMFSDKEIKQKRILIRKLKRDGLQPKYINMFLKLLEYIEENV